MKRCVFLDPPWCSYASVHSQCLKIIIYQSVKSVIFLLYIYYISKLLIILSIGSKFNLQKITILAARFIAKHWFVTYQDSKRNTDLEPSKIYSETLIRNLPELICLRALSGVSTVLSLTPSTPSIIALISFSVAVLVPSGCFRIWWRKILWGSDDSWTIWGNIDSIIYLVLLLLPNNVWDFWLKHVNNN